MGAVVVYENRHPLAKGHMATPFKIPKTLGECADLAYKLKEEKAELNRQIKDIEERESELREHFIAQVAKSNAAGVTGKLANVKVVTKTKPTAEDWDKFYAFVKKKGWFHLMQRRLSEPAIAELWESGIEVPGIGRFDAKTLSITKAK